MGSTIARTHAGRIQREQGAWSWFLDKPGASTVGSQWPGRVVERCLRLHGAEISRDSTRSSSGDTHVDPCAACRTAFLAAQRH